MRLANNLHSGRAKNISDTPDEMPFPKIAIASCCKVLIRSMHILGESRASTCKLDLFRRHVASPIRYLFNLSLLSN